MDKKIQSVREFVTNEKNRTMIAVIAGGVVVVVAGIATYTAKRGKKRK